VCLAQLRNYCNYKRFSSLRYFRSGTAITCGWGDIKGGSNQGISMVVVVAIVVAGATVLEVEVVVVLAVVMLAIGVVGVIGTVRKD
jgi:hypothetical protein